jgi:hypothetical protein
MNARQHFPFVSGGNRNSGDARLRRGSARGSAGREHGAERCIDSGLLWHMDPSHLAAFEPPLAGPGPL